MEGVANKLIANLRDATAAGHVASIFPLDSASISIICVQRNCDSLAPTKKRSAFGETGVRGKNMRRILLIVSLFVLLVQSTPAFSQSTFATVSGTVADGSGAVLPGVSVSATNNGTAVVTTVITNETGVYSLVSLLPGAYTVSAELPGFQKRTYTNVQLGNADRVRLNLALELASRGKRVE